MVEVELEGRGKKILDKAGEKWISVTSFDLIISVFSSKNPHLPLTRPTHKGMTYDPRIYKPPPRGAPQAFRYQPHHPTGLAVREYPV